MKQAGAAKRQRGAFEDQILYQNAVRWGRGE
jgi:hypothetical protein